MTDPTKPVYRLPYLYRAKIDRIIDGDTYVLAVDLGFRVSLVITGRLRGVDCPELNTPAGVTARKYVADLIAAQPDLVIQSYKDQQSFARWIVDVWLTDGRSLSDVLVDAGQATRSV